MTIDPYFSYHIRRLVKATNDLWKEKDSICKKCHLMAYPMNCLLYYCPRYNMGTECGGDFVILDNGVKDCSNCNKPHDRVFVEEYLKAKLKGDE
jgi:Zn-finger protein